MSWLIMPMNLDSFSPAHFTCTNNWSGHCGGEERPKMLCQSCTSHYIVHFPLTHTIGISQVSAQYQPKCIFRLSYHERQRAVHRKMLPCIIDGSRTARMPRIYHPTYSLHVVPTWFQYKPGEN